MAGDDSQVRGSTQGLVGATGRSPVLRTNRTDVTTHGAVERRATCRSPLQDSGIRDRLPLQVLLDRERDLRAAEAGTIDLQVLEHALDVVTRLRERNALDP